MATAVARVGLEAVDLEEWRKGKRDTVKIIWIEYEIDGYPAHLCESDSLPNGQAPA